MPFRHLVDGVSLGRSSRDLSSSLAFGRFVRILPLIIVALVVGLPVI